MNKSRLITVGMTLLVVAVAARTAQGQKLLLNRTA